MRRLALAGFEGHEWEAFRADLAGYAIARIRTWTANGKIFALCASQGFGSLPVADRTPEDAEDLAVETVAEALNFFRDRVLMKKRWKAEGGASLKTFFIGACLRRFSNTYRRWYAEMSRAAQLRSPEGVDAMARGTVRLPDHGLLMSAELEAVLATASDDVTREIVLLRAAGHSENEIAKELDITRKAVEGRLGRFSQSLRHDREHPDTSGAIVPRDRRSGRPAKSRPT